MAYVRPVSGALGPGGAKFGQGAGGKNRYDHTARGAGLWSIGIDPQSPTLQLDIENWLKNQDSKVQGEVNSYWKNNRRSGNAGQDLFNSVDWRQRDVARKIKIVHGTFDFLGPLEGLAKPALTIAAAALPGGQFLAPIVGAGLGAMDGGGMLGALMGAAGGFGATSAVNAFSGAGGWSTLLKNPGAFASNLGRNALTSAQNTLFGGDVASKIATGKGLVAGGSQLAQAARTAGGAAMLAGKAAGATGTLQKLAGIGAPVAATAALLSAINTKIPAVTSSAPNTPSTTPDNVVDIATARAAAAKSALGSTGPGDMVATGMLGATGNARTRRKKLLGY